MTPFDASKVERFEAFRNAAFRQNCVLSSDFDACAAALSETREENETLRSESAENDRIIGMSGSREAALLAEVEKLKKIVREYRESHAQSIRTMTVDMEPVSCIVRTAGLVNGTQIDDRCSICKAADEALGGGK